MMKSPLLATYLIHQTHPAISVRFISKKGRKRSNKKNKVPFHLIILTCKYYLILKFP